MPYKPTEYPKQIRTFTPPNPLSPPPHLLKRHIGVHDEKIPQKGIKGTCFNQEKHVFCLKKNDDESPTPTPQVFFLLQKHVLLTLT